MRPTAGRDIQLPEYHQTAGGGLEPAFRHMDATGRGGTDYRPGPARVGLAPNGERIRRPQRPRHRAFFTGRYINHQQSPAVLISAQILPHLQVLKTLSDSNVTAMPKRILFVFTSADKTLLGAQTVRADRWIDDVRYAIGTHILTSQRRAGTSPKRRIHTTVHFPDRLLPYAPPADRRRPFPQSSRPSTTSTSPPPLGPTRPSTRAALPPSRRTCPSSSRTRP